MKTDFYAHPYAGVIAAAALEEYRFGTARVVKLRPAFQMPVTPDDEMPPPAAPALPVPMARAA